MGRAFPPVYLASTRAEVVIGLTSLRGRRGGGDTTGTRRQRCDSFRWNNRSFCIQSSNGPFHRPTSNTAVGLVVGTVPVLIMAG
jgi:hypothetical protein